MERKNLIHTDKPNLLEEVFPHTLPPRILFSSQIFEEIDGKIVTFDPASVVDRDIYITDTTFRDGQQSRPPYTIEQTVHIFDLLSKLSGPNGVVRQSEFFVYSDKDREAVEKCKELGHTYPEITSWIRADSGDFSFVKRVGVKETGMLTSSSDYHIFLKQRQTRQQAFDKYIGVVEQALEADIRPRCHLEDVTRADIEGFVIPFVQKLVELSEQVPDDLKVKVRLCDTMGFGVSYPGVALPRSIPKLIYTMIHTCGMPGERLEWHGHNDFHKVHINGVTGWIYGVDAVNTTLFGFGERTGNPPLEGSVFEYAALKGTLNGMDTMAIGELADYFRQMGIVIPPNFPFAGKDFNRTRAGIHAGGLTRDERIYNIFDTTNLLGVPPQVSITDKSGSDGIVLWVKNFLGLKEGDRLKKTKLVKIMRWVSDQYDKEGRTTAISEEEMEEQVRLHLPDLYAAAKRRS